MTKPKSQLFQYGVANAFIEGVYEGELPVSELLEEGDFGLGAPNLIDGELTIVGGKAYQSNAKGETFEAPTKLNTPFAFVTKFRPDTVCQLPPVQSIEELFSRIRTLLPNPNSMYALHITGKFSEMKTRAFPPVKQKPFIPIARQLDRQVFMKLNETEGEMIGFYMPVYLSGINIAGLHFHFLSDDRKSGGHVVGLAATALAIEIEEVKDFNLQIPQMPDFKSFKFIGNNNLNLQKIEKGTN